ncbi:MAG: AAA family ATPase [Gemmatimonadota bacterium]
MIPIQLTLRNFLSYGAEPIALDFTGFHVACLTGDNGHGKSALLDAITYALWGEARKGRGDRKPDEGLLRLGAEEMRVEFEFQLDDRRFRVMRTFRRRRRPAATELELQVWDAGAGIYHPLSESASTAQTQARIDQLLAMDYDTFVNSAFILQGRADEFTRRSAGERKQVLAEILGLSRYDRLQERARSHAAAAERQTEELQRRAGQVDGELAARPACDASLQAVQLQLAELAERLVVGERAVEEVGRQLAEARTRREQLQLLEQEEARLRSRQDELDGRRRELLAQEERDAALLAQEQAVETEYQAFSDLCGEEARWNAALTRVRELELQAAALEGHVREERHRLQTQAAGSRSRREALEAQVREAAALLEREDEIAARQAALQAARQEERRLADLQERCRALTEQRLHLSHQVEMAARRLTDRRQDLERQSDGIRVRLASRDRLARQIEAETRHLEAAREQQTALHELRDAGAAQRARVEELAGRLVRVRAEAQRLEDRGRVLQQSGEAACPLCGSVLDVQHRAQLARELAAEGERWTREVAGIEGQQRQAAAELEEMRRRYRAAEACVADIEQLQETLVALSAQEARLADEALRAAQLDREVEELADRLERGEYAAEARQSLVALAGQLADLGFEASDLARAREAVETLAPVEAEVAGLREARLRRDRSAAALVPIGGELAELELRLADASYPPDETRDLAACRRRLAEEGYDAARHAAVGNRLRELAAAADRHRSLREARQRRAEAQQFLVRLTAETGQLEALRAEAVDRSQQLREVLAGLDGTESLAEDWRRQVAECREAREALLQEAGSLQSQRQRLKALAEERRQLDSRLRATARQAWLYRQLAQAFGRDGIQALVIEGVVPEIEEEANALLRRLTDNRIHVSIESLRDLKGGGTRETLDIQIADELGVRSYHLYSGGEAFRTDFALRIALSKVLARRAGTRLRTLVIDEGFGTQDSHGLEQLKEAIQEISRDFDKVLVVTHLAELKDAFPVQIEVTKDPEWGSQLRVVDLR